MVGHGFARANQKSIAVVPMKGSNKSPQILGLKVGEHSQFRLLVLLLPRIPLDQGQLTEVPLYFFKRNVKKGSRETI